MSVIDLRVFDAIEIGSNIINDERVTPFDLIVYVYARDMAQSFYARDVDTSLIADRLQCMQRDVAASIKRLELMGYLDDQKPVAIPARDSRRRSTTYRPTFQNDGYSFAAAGNRHSRTSTWKTRIRAAVGERDGWTCNYCDIQLVEPGREEDLGCVWRDWSPEPNYHRSGWLIPMGMAWPTLDHVHPLSRGGTDSIENIVLACRPCNTQKGTKTLVEIEAKQ